jgi:glycosidase
VNQWNHELRNWVKTLISTRQRTPALRRGEFVWVYGDDIARCYAFARLLGGENVVIALNASPSQHSLRLPVSNLGWEEGKIARNLLTPGEFPVSQEALHINLPPWSGIWLA